MKTFVVGVGMTTFKRAGRNPDWQYTDIGKEAIEDAFKDSKLNINNIEAVVASYCYGDSTSGQRVFREVGLTSVPVFNVNNNCASGSSALFLAKRLVEAGNDCVMAIGFEKMERGLSENYPNAPKPTQPHFEVALNKFSIEDMQMHPKLNPMTSGAMCLFTSVGLEYMKKNELDKEAFQKIANKNHKHASLNPKACAGKVIPMDKIVDPKFKLTKLLYTEMASPAADGGACAIVVSEKFLKNNPHLQSNAVEILAMEMLSDRADYDQSVYDAVGGKLGEVAVQRIMQKTKKSMQDVNIVELHDCYAPNELVHYEALGLCPKGQANKFLSSMKWIKTEGGGELAQFENRVIVNPSGGLIGKGHPLGATGLAQCYEICKQLTNRVEKPRQVPNPKLALQHNLGVGSACVVGLYQKFNGKFAREEHKSKL